MTHKLSTLSALINRPDLANETYVRHRLFVLMVLLSSPTALRCRPGTLPPSSFFLFLSLFSELPCSIKSVQAPTYGSVPPHNAATKSKGRDQISFYFIRNIGMPDTLTKKQTEPKKFSYSKLTHSPTLQENTNINPHLFFLQRYTVL